MADWSREEVDLIVADYFDMLRADLFNERYSKTEHREALSPLLEDRSKGSIEFKHQNISAVMVMLGLPYVDGYKPRGNYQALLAEGVKDYLTSRPELLESLTESPRMNPDRVPPVPAFWFAKENPPDQIIVPVTDSKPWLSRKGWRIDFAARDARNRHLAMLGEEWVVRLEQNRLRSAKRPDLAERVDHVAKSIGDGLGFDVLSFDDQDESERLIEVKTTTFGKEFPFYVTSNEVRCSEDVGEQFNLYRVFDFSRAARFFALQGPLANACRLEPVQYIARL